jgi:CRISPR-associated protein Cmr2
MNHLFLFTIGPVQTFLAQARKAQDLFAGSLLISDLTRTAINAAKKEGIDVIFPDVSKTGDSVPNRFIGTCQIADVKSGTAIENAVRDRWKAIAAEALRGGVAKPLHFDDQVEGLLEIYWMFHPVTPNRSYFEVCQEADRWFGALKNMRNATVSLPETGRKCSVDGVRNVRFYRPLPGENNVAQLMGSKLFQPNDGVSITLLDDPQKFKPLPAVLQPGEGLSAVSFIKRRFEAQKVKSFESTAAVALMDDVQQLIDKEIKKEWTKGAEAYRAFIGLFERKVDYFDEQLFYEENLTPQYLKKYGYEAVVRNPSDWETVKNNHEILKGWLKQKYYAILLFDGDSMGDLISGKFLPDKSESAVVQFQCKLSGLLGEFAATASQLLSYPKGRTVYAGGDDFLGFVNLYHLLPVLHMLREQFDIMVNEPLQKEFHLKDTNNQPFYFSFSAGVAVAHYKIPLNIVLQEARNAEKRAKQSGRNALGLSVLKHSGETHQSVMQWSSGNNNKPARHAKLLGQLLEGLQGGYSDQFIRALQLQTARLSDDFYQSAGRSELLKTELKRLVARARPEHIEKDEAIIWAETTVFPLFEACKGDFNAFMNLLLSVHFLHSKMGTTA